MRGWALGYLSSLGVAVALAALIGLTPSLARAQCAGDHNLRIMTFNAYVLPLNAQNLMTGPTPQSAYGFEDGERLREKIVPRVLRVDPDIVVFQEVSRGNVGDWQDELLETYPHAVLEIDDDGGMADSGMMVFSKFPFVPFDGAHCMNGFTTHVCGINNGQEFDKDDCVVNTDIYKRWSDHPTGDPEMLYLEDAQGARERR